MNQLQETIIELRSEAEWKEAFPILQSLRTELTEDQLLRRRDEVQKDKFTLFGLRINQELVAVAGVDLYPHLSRGIDCWVHDLVTKEAMRSKGYGERLMRHIEKWAKDCGCTRISVHTKLDRKNAQRFYETKLGYPRSAVIYSQDI